MCFLFQLHSPLEICLCNPKHQQVLFRNGFLEFLIHSSRILTRSEHIWKSTKMTTISASIQPHSWIEPHPLSFHAKNNFLCVFYVVIWGQKSILKNRTPGLYWSRYGIWILLIVSAPTISSIQIRVFWATETLITSLERSKPLLMTQSKECFFLPSARIYLQSG